MLYDLVTYSLSSCITILNLKNIPSRSALLTLKNLNILLTYSENKLSNENLQSGIFVHAFRYKGKRIKSVLAFVFLKYKHKALQL